MTEYEIGAQGRARVWLFDQPDCLFVPADVQELTFSAGVAAVGGERSAAVEGCVHIGGYLAYGLAGARYVPDGSAQLRLRTYVSGQDGPEYLTSVASGLDVAYIGLPAEFSKSIATGVNNALEKIVIGGGILAFDRAAHGLVGSSPMFFARLATVVTMLIGLKTSALSDDEIRATIRTLSFR